MAGSDRVASGSPERAHEPHAGRARGAAGWVDAIWIGILVAAGSFQIGRGAPVEGIPFVIGALALIIDSLGWMPGPDSPVRRPEAPRWVVALPAVASAVVVGIAPVFSWPAGVLVLAAGLLAVAPGWGRREPVALAAPGDGAAIRRAAVCWAAVAVALCLWELISFFLGLPSAHADWEHPALSDLLRPALGVPALRGALFAGWVVAGWGFVRRGWAVES